MKAQEITVCIYVASLTSNETVEPVCIQLPIHQSCTLTDLQFSVIFLHAIATLRLNRPFFVNSQLWLIDNEGLSIITEPETIGLAASL